MTETELVHIAAVAEEAGCPCGGKNRQYHKRLGEPACEEIKAAERARERRRARCWTPGSPIQLPDTDYIL